MRRERINSDLRLDERRERKRERKLRGTIYTVAKTYSKYTHTHKIYEALESRERERERAKLPKGTNFIPNNIGLFFWS